MRSPASAIRSLVISLMPGCAHYPTNAPARLRSQRQVGECAPQLAAVGTRARELGVRLSFHPGQYVVLNSERKEVRTPRDAVNPRAHADYVDAAAFAAFLDGPAAGLKFDVMIEAKAKDRALLRLREDLRRS